MVPENVRQSVEHAMQAFRVAENELNRPNEDAVTLCACHNTRNSVNQFLHSFLQSRSADKADKHLDDLLQQCSKLDSRFRSIDLSCFKCGMSGAERCDHTYCLSVEKVSECFSQASAVKQLVMEKLQLSEKDFE